MHLAKYLLEHVSVKRVNCPGLQSHPSHAIASRQMKQRYGGVFIVEFESEAMAMAVAGALTTVFRATSLGGTETLIEHRASIEPPGRVTSPAGLLRVSIGLEDPADLIEDFGTAINIANEIFTND
jgi:cystathionine gamma-synthase